MSPCKLRFALLCAVIGTLISMIDQAKAQGIERASLSGETVAQQLKQSGVDEAIQSKAWPRSHSAPKPTIRFNSTTTSASSIMGASPTSSSHPAWAFPLYADWKVSDLNKRSFRPRARLRALSRTLAIRQRSSRARFRCAIQFLHRRRHRYPARLNFSYQQDPTAIGQLSNQTQLSRWQNDVGVTTTWDLDQVAVLTFDYDYTPTCGSRRAPTVT